MATVRMSQKLIDQMVTTAGNKFNKQNPPKAYPATAGDSFVTDNDLVNKALLSKKQLEEVWSTFEDFDYDTIQIHSIELTSSVESEPDGDGDTYMKNKSFQLELTTPIEVPNCFSRNYGCFTVKVKPDHPIFVECYSVDNFNRRIRDELYSFKRELRDTLTEFTTLNQALKASNNSYAGIVPQESMQRVMQKDDRKQREQELATIAQKDISKLQEILLTDSLLGDD